jgi:cardiolipin synthase
VAYLQVAAANRAGWLRQRLARIDLRNHRTIIAVDGHIGYTGSLNIIDPALFKVRTNVGQWVDYMARIDGPAAHDLQRVFRRDWSLEHPGINTSDRP